MEKKLGDKIVSHLVEEDGVIRAVSKFWGNPPTGNPEKDANLLAQSLYLQLFNGSVGDGKAKLDQNPEKFFNIRIEANRSGQLIDVATKHQEDLAISTDEGDGVICDGSICSGPVPAMGFDIYPWGQQRIKGSPLEKKLEEFGAKTVDILAKHRINNPESLSKVFGLQTTQKRGNSKAQEVVYH